MVLTRRRQCVGLCLAALILASSPCLAARADDAKGPAGSDDQVVQRIDAVNTTIDLMVNTSRILSMDGPIPKAQVGNPDLLDFTVLSENQVQIHAKKPGITAVNLWDSKNTVHTIDVIISGDVRELDRLLKTQFPTASLKLFPTAASTLIVFGYVDRADYVNRIMRIAEDYYPKVINNMVVGGSQQVLLHVRVMEVSRTKLRVLGFDFMNFSGNDFMGSSVAGLITKASSTTDLFRTGSSFTTAGRETLQLGIVNNPSGFVGFLEALKQDDLLKVLAEPNLVALSGRPAHCNVGGEMPYPMPTGFGNISIAFRPFGTQIDFVPIVLGGGACRLEVRPRVSEIDPTLSTTVNGTSVPGFRVREADTGVELKFGQTLAIAGLLQQRTEQEVKGIPGLMDVPFLGALFRRQSNSINEVELLIMVRPELVEALDPDQVPPCGPGANSMNPDDCGLYWKGYNEVPIKPPAFNPNGPGPQMPYGLPPLDPNAPIGPAGPTIQPAPGPTEETLPPPATPPAPSAKAPGKRGPAARQDLRTAALNSKGNGQKQDPAAPAAQPAAANPPKPTNPQSPNTPTPANPKNAPPGFIGPTGYDVKN